LTRYYRYYILFITLLVCSCNSVAQNFNFIGDKTSQTFNFKLINNLIILPIEVNGSELFFILDSGVSASVVFNLSTSDTLELRGVKKVQLRGLGDGDPIDAFHSKNNQFRMGNIVAYSKGLYVIYKDQFDLSAKLGITVHGMIGYDLFKNFVVTINYISKKITFTKPGDYTYRNCAKCETFELEFYKNKPYINGEIVAIDSDKKQTVKLLIDSGGSDSLWLFEDDEFQVPENSFDDFIGEGVTGSLFGKRNKLKTFSLGNFVFKEPNVAYLDSVSTFYAKRFEKRNGSLGAEILKRFKVIFDYPNSKITLKKNSSFKKKFGYNMSGIELMYSGKELVRKKGNSTFLASENEGGASGTKAIYFNINYDYEFKPIYKILQVRKGSPAEEVGLKIGDVLVKINGLYSYKYTLQEIIEKFYQKKGKKIRLLVNRSGEELEFEFKLKDLLQ